MHFSLVGYCFILRNFITQREVNWTIGSFLCFLSIDYSFDDIKTVRKFLTSFEIDISCHRATNKIPCYYTILSYQDISRSRYRLCNAANKIFCFHSSNHVNIHNHCVRILQISTIQFRSNLRFEIFRLYFISSYIVIITIYFLQNRDKFQHGRHILVYDA